MCVEHHIHTKVSTEQDTDRWCSHAPCGQEFWQILNQWLWNLRLDLGQHLSPSPLRLTEFAPAAEPPAAPPSDPLRNRSQLPLPNHRKRRHRFFPANPLSMALPNGRAHRSPKGLLAPILCRNPMAPYAAQLAIHFPSTSADLSATARSAWSMVLALRIAVPVLFEHSVKKPPRRRNRGKSALFFGPFHPFRLSPLLPLSPFPSSVKGRLLCPLLLPHPHLPLFFGETGHVVCFVVAGFVCCARKPSS